MIEAVSATGMTAVSGITTWVQDVDGVLQLIVTVATLAWWARLWIKRPELPPPQLNKSNADEKDPR